MPGRSQRVLAGLHEIGLEPRDIAHILLTHQDVDHIGNAKTLVEQSGATLWAPALEVPFIHGEKKGEGMRRVIGALMRVDRPHVDRTYEEGVHIGDLEVIPAPGHTRGHVCLKVGDVLLAGDLVKSSRGVLQPSPGFLTADKAALRSSLRTVGSLSFDWVCPAHGEPVRRGNLWDALVR
ncbi:MAG: MBL fold metallo-hydrolase [Firmicutes bacterium]|nr:MBL fold metallo-hydrolase [Bacillota bacterium]